MIITCTAFKEILQYVYLGSTVNNRPKITENLTSVSIHFNALKNVNLVCRIVLICFYASDFGKKLRGHIGLGLPVRLSVCPLPYGEEWLELES